MKLYPESNGTSARRGQARRVSSAAKFSLAARATSAASVGSPTTSPASLTVASLHSARRRARRVKSGTDVPATDSISPDFLYPSPSTVYQWSPK